MAYLFRLNGNAAKVIHKRIGLRAFAAKVVENPEEYTNQPNYPPIVDISYETRKQRQIEAYHEEYKQVGTVEEKLFKLNLPKYYGYKSLMLSEENLPYNCLGLVQHGTRTDLKEGNKELVIFIKN